MRIFKPTGTSTALINAVKPYVVGGKLLDLGCGSGVVGAALSHLVDDLYASDISEEAAYHTALEYPDILVRCGNLFAPWEGEKFNYIVDDVSGVAEEIAKISPWFEGVPCNSGKDGANLVVEVLKEAPKYLAEGGKLFFPIVSLSNVNHIRDVARDIYRLELLSQTDFPLPKEMWEHEGLLEKLRSEGIEFHKRFGMLIFSTYIYKAEL